MVDAAVLIELLGYFVFIVVSLSQVCLIYVERLMETANVPLLAGNWKPVLLCGLLLASKVIRS